jgi:hypothetical protein
MGTYAYAARRSPLPGLHSGLDSFCFNTIPIVQLTIHWGQQSMSQLEPLNCCGLLLNTALCCPEPGTLRSLVLPWSKSFYNQVKSKHSSNHQLWFLFWLPQCRQRPLAFAKVSPMDSGFWIEHCHHHTYPAHANKMVRNIKLQKPDSKQSWPRTNMAACTINVFADGCEEHYQWLHLWTSHRDRDNKFGHWHYQWLHCRVTDGSQALSRTSLMDTTEGGERNNHQQNYSMNHQMGLKLTLAILKRPF